MRISSLVISSVLVLTGTAHAQDTTSNAPAPASVSANKPALMQTNDCCRQSLRCIQLGR